MQCAFLRSVNLLINAVNVKTVSYTIDVAVCRVDFLQRDKYIVVWNKTHVLKVTDKARRENVFSSIFILLPLKLIGQIKPT